MSRPEHQAPAEIVNISFCLRINWFLALLKSRNFIGYCLTSIDNSTIKLDFNKLNFVENYESIIFTKFFLFYSG